MRTLAGMMPPRPNTTSAPLLPPAEASDSSAAGGTPEESALQPKLGWFMGVFVPTMNCIYGVVVFRRWGWAVAEAGIGQVFLMLVLGHVIAIVTCSSLAAICTNGKVGPGGAYYIISRALGPEFGGSIGALFYIAQSLGVAFYLLGLAETML